MATQSGAAAQPRPAPPRRFPMCYGSAYRSKLFAQALRQANARHVRTRPYTPRTNGKAERFIQTSLREWAYAKPYASSAERAQAIKPWAHSYNWNRPMPVSEASAQSKD